MSSLNKKLKCPKCGSTRVAVLSSLRFRDREAIEKTMVRCRCVDCGFTFVVFR